MEVPLSNQSSGWKWKSWSQSAAIATLKCTESPPRIFVIKWSLQGWGPWVWNYVTKPWKHLIRLWLLTFVYGMHAVYCWGACVLTVQEGRVVQRRSPASEHLDWKRGGRSQAVDGSELVKCLIRGCGSSLAACHGCRGSQQVLATSLWCPGFSAMTALGQDSSHGWLLPLILPFRQQIAGMPRDHGC